MWGVYRGYHPRCGPTPPRPLRAHLLARLRDGPVSDVVAVIVWAHESQDERARYLQEHDYLGIDNLLRAEKYPARVEMAQAWEARGRTAPTSTGPPPRQQPLLNGTATAWALVTGWVSEIHHGTRTRLPSETPDEIRIVTAFSAAGGRKRYERERNLEPMQAEFARHLGHG